MRVLFLAHRVPYPPDKGDKIRAFQELRALVARGHQVHLFAFADDPEDVRHRATLAELGATVEIIPLDPWRAKLRALAGLVGRAPLSIRYFASAQMRRSVVCSLAGRELDAALVSSGPMAQYVPPALAARTVVDLVDVDSEKWLAYAHRRSPPWSWLFRVEWRRLRRYERAIVDRFAHTVVTTAREAALLERPDDATLPTSLHAITNGVDLERYRPATWPGSEPIRLPAAERRFLPASAGPRLVFTGVMDYYPNVDAVRYFAEEVLPLVRACEPRAELLVVGRDPIRSVRRLGERPGVTITGYVEDVRPYLAAATVCVAPLRVARGVQNKILEAMASGRPVVATPEAAAGLRTDDGEHLLVGRDAAELAGAVVSVIRDARLRTELGARARAFVEREHGWGPMMERLARLVESVAAVEDTAMLSTDDSRAANACRAS
jgi:sugar transferase (PEP-CTERM/EpsH1 system associated)